MSTYLMLGKLIFRLKFLKIFWFDTTSITSIYSKALTECPFFTLSLTILKMIAPYRDTADYKLTLQRL